MTFPDLTTVTLPTLAWIIAGYFVGLPAFLWLICGPVFAVASEADRQGAGGGENNELHGSQE